MKKTYLLGSMILSIVALVAVIVVLSVTGVLGSAEVKTLVFASESRSGVYNGSPLTDGGWQLLSGELDEGHTAEVTVFGSQTNAGSSENSLSVKIVDENKADVTSEYNIELRPGTLTVNPINIKIASESASKPFDGIALSNHFYQIISGKTLADHRLEVTFSASQTNVGTADNVIAAAVKDANGADVTANYKIDTVYGKLTVTGIPIVLSTGSYTKVYDGTPLTLDSYEILSGSLRYGDEIVVNVTGSQKDVGESENAFVVNIYDLANIDVTANYDITAIPGKLKVEKLGIEVATEGKSVSYKALHETGGVLTHPVATLNGTLAYNHTYEITVTGSVEGVGSAKNSFFIEIWDENGNVVTQNYDVSESLGELRVLPVDIVVTSAGATWTYDEYIKSGKQPLKNNSYDASFGDLLEGHSLQVTVVGEQLGVGTSTNDFVVKVVNENGIDVTDLYSVWSERGKLTVKPIYMSIPTQGGALQYDGVSILTVDPAVNWDAVVEQLYEGHYINSYVFPDFLTEVGTIPNRVILSICDENGADVTECYYIDEASFGLLEMTPIPVYIASDGITVEYNGEEVRHEVYFETGDAILDGHKLTVLFTAHPVDAGIYDNTMRFIVEDENGIDVTKNYRFLVTYGKIDIKPITITIRTESRVEKYTGELVTAPGWEIVSGTNVLDGHTLTVVVSGAQLYTGSSPNYVAEIKVVDEENRIVTQNYDFSRLQLGVITVVDPSASSVDDPNRPKIPGATDVLLANIKSSVTGAAYLRTTSYGNFNGNGFDEATPYDRHIENTYGMSYLTSFALKNADYISNRMEIEYKHTMYFLPYYLDTDVADYKIQKNDVYFQDSSCVDAMMYYYAYWYNENGAPTFELPAEYAELEREYREYVKNTYTVIDDKYSKTIANLKEIISQKGLDKGDKIQNVIDFLQSDEFTYNLEYNRMLDSEDDAVTAFLTVYKQGVCRHYATAATLLLRAMDIPARYTVGVAAEIETADTWTEIYSNRAHAWVEAYIDGVGWVALEVTGPDRAFPDPGDPGIILPNPGPGPDNPDLNPFPCEPGFSNVIAGPDPDSDGHLVASINPSVSGPVYLRLTNYGDYKGKLFDYPPFYENQLADGYGMAYLTSFALKNASYISERMLIQYKSDEYVLPYYLEVGSGEYDIQGNDVLFSSEEFADATVFYHDYSYSKEGLMSLELPLEYRAAEELYREFVKENYTAIDEAYCDIEALNQIIREYHLDVGDKLLNVKTLLQGGTFKYNGKYNRALDNEDDIVVAFLTEYKEGVCAHFASSATLLLRAMGVPARYTVGVSTDSLEANTWNDVYSKNAHAWVEAYIDGIGWVMLEVTAPGGDDNTSDEPIFPGSLEITPNIEYQADEITGTIYATFEMATFAGNDVYNSFINGGGSIKACVLVGEANKYGTTPLTIEEGSVILLNAKGEDVTDRYNIVLKPGKMKVFASRLIITSQSMSSEYTSKPVSWDHVDVEGYIDPRHELKVNFGEGKIDAGTYANYFDCEVVDKVTGEKVEGYYLIEKRLGNIIIRKMNMTFYGHSAEISLEELDELYGGTYTPGEDDYTYTGKLFSSADGTYYHYIAVVTQTGSITGWSECETVIQKVIILDSLGKDVTKNYKFTFENGWIESY